LSKVYFTRNSDEKLTFYLLISINLVISKTMQTVSILQKSVG